MVQATQAPPISQITYGQPGNYSSPMIRPETLTCWNSDEDIVGIDINGHVFGETVNLPQSPTLRLTNQEYISSYKVTYGSRVNTLELGTNERPQAWQSGGVNPGSNSDPKSNIVVMGISCSTLNGVLSSITIHYIQL